MAGEFVKISMSGSRAVIGCLDKLGPVLPEALSRSIGRIGAVLRWKMTAQLASGQPLGTRSGDGARSVVAKIGTDKRGIVSLMVFPRKSYIWMNAFGFPRTLLKGVGGQRMAVNTKTGEVRVLGARKRARKKEMAYKAGGYDRFHVLKPRPFAPLVLSANEAMVVSEINQAVNAATKGAGLGS